MQRLLKQKKHENLLKKIVSGWGFQQGTNIELAIVAVCYPLAHLLCKWPFYLCTKQGSDSYEFVLFVNYMNSQVTGDMNSYFLMQEFASHINMAYHYCPDQLGCVRLPRPVRVRLAAPTSQGAFGCPNQLGCVRLPRPVRVRPAAPISQGAHSRGCGLEMGIGSRTGYI